MYKKILVPVVFDDDGRAAKAIEVAQVLADDGAELTLLHVIEHIPPYVVSYLPEDYVRESRRAIISELQSMAETLANAKSAVVDGHSGRTILDYAKEVGSDCIVIASHRPVMQDLLIGSTASHVVRHANCAVHVLR